MGIEIELDLSTIIELSEWVVAFPEASIASREFEGDASYSAEMTVILVSKSEACREALGIVRGPSRDFTTGLKTRPPFTDILLIYLVWA